MSLPGYRPSRLGPTGVLLGALVLAASLLASLLSGLAVPAAADSGVSGGLPLLSAPPAGGLVTVPPVDGLVLNAAPQSLTVPGVGSERMQLVDQSGGVIAFTTRSDGSAGLPRLLPGQYELTVGDSSGSVARFAVEGPAGKLSVLGWDFASPPPVWPAFLMAAVLLLLGVVLGVVLVRSRRWRLLPLVLLPLLVGAVVAGAAQMLANGTSTPPSLAVCLGGNQLRSDEQAECGMRRLTFLLSQDQFEQAVDELYGVAGCHDFGHEFARRAFVMVPDRARLLAPEKAVCTEGFLHGVMYSAAMYLDDAQYRSFMDGFCESIKASHGFSIGSCAHGVGHGWVMRTNARLADSQHECSQAFDSDFDLRQECTGAGIYEYVGTFASAQGRPGWMPSDAVEPEQLCASLSTDSELPLEWCYTALATSHGWRSARDLEYAQAELSSCAGLSGLPRQQLCVRGVVRTFPSAVGTSPADMAVCKTALPSGPLRETCAKFAALYIANGTLDNSHQSEVCAAVGVPASVCENRLSESWQQSAEAAAATAP